MICLRLLFGIVFGGAGILHFTHERNFRSIVPAYLPFRTAAVLVSGVIEMLFGLLLLIKQPTNFLKYSIIVFLWAVLPANIYMARKQLPLAGHHLPKWVLYTRIPLQFLMIKLIKKL
ncbi:DoxX family protein [Staphylococcus caeli]|uniref:Membrane protein n=1 Tax=Staphylococcus caeli TaxID=2201815 RepID=A0A1D4QPM8_9STAP|nr:hypothetical protein [Staphylococcus caeli]SCT32269.1 membrane protein [Staphylococcus caeli]SCT37166.1 membrane protein [Staphylococcus caeli]